MRDGFPKCPVMALTATATPAVCADIKRHLRMRNPRDLRNSFNRPNIEYHVDYLDAAVAPPSTSVLPLPDVLVSPSAACGLP